MRSRDELLQILDGVCAEIRDSAIGDVEVAERLVVVASSEAAVDHSVGTSTYHEGNVVAFVNNSGVPFVEQSDDLIDQVAGLRPEAVLLAGSALTGRPGAIFRKVLAVQLFSVIHGIRLARIAPVEETNGVISAVAPWKDVKAGPAVWAERLLELRA
ncbi:hypothetical protein [Catenulispora pinisilvae]|uniref:hypothetical protein n=1 Tax=Catenulispora pinisilvae TaxID=2705253 RepID=UPI00189220E4|nr:hypothetical protein [Catenulispora pinisilvae]